MKIEFDSGNAAEIIAVTALLDNLAGRTMTGPGHDEPIGVTLVRPFVAGEPFSAEAAFDGPDAEQAFAAPLAAAPVAATPPPPSPAPSTDAPAPTVNLDKSGLPWDARIHSSPPSTIKDGTWRRKRGLDEATEQAVIAELRQVMGAPAPAAAPAQAVPPPPLAQAEPVVAAPATPTPAPPAPPTTPAVAATEPGALAAIPASDFASLMRRITGAQTSGLLTVEQTKEIAESLGITGVRDLIHRPDLIPSFDALLPVA